MLQDYQDYNAGLFTKDYECNNNNLNPNPNPEVEKYLMVTSISLTKDNNILNILNILKNCINIFR